MLHSFNVITFLLALTFFSFAFRSVIHGLTGINSWDNSQSRGSIGSVGLLEVGAHVAVTRKMSGVRAATRDRDSMLLSLLTGMVTFGGRL